MTIVKIKNFFFKKSRAPTQRNHCRSKIESWTAFSFYPDITVPTPSFFPVPFQVSFRSSIWVLNYNFPNTLACNSLGWTRFHYCSHTRPISLDSLLGLEPTICLQHLSNLLILGLSLPTTRHLNHTSRQTAYRQNHHDTLRILKNHSKSQYLFSNALDC